MESKTTRDLKNMSARREAQPKADAGPPTRRPGDYKKTKELSVKSNPTRGRDQKIAAMMMNSDATGKAWIDFDPLSIPVAELDNLFEDQKYKNPNKTEWMLYWNHGDIGARKEEKVRVNCKINP